MRFRDLNNEAPIDWAATTPPTFYVKVLHEGGELLSWNLAGEPCKGFLREALRFETLLGAKDAALAVSGADDLFRELVESASMACGFRAGLQIPLRIDQWQSQQAMIKHWARSGCSWPIEVVLEFSVEADSSNRGTPDPEALRGRVESVFHCMAGGGPPSAPPRKQNPKRGFCLSMTHGADDGSDGARVFFGLKASDWKRWVRKHPRFAALDAWEIPNAWAAQAPFARLGASRCSWTYNPLYHFRLAQDPRVEELFPMVGIGAIEALDAEACVRAASELFSFGNKPIPAEPMPKADHFGPQGAVDPFDAKSKDFFESFDAFSLEEKIEKTCAPARPAPRRGL